MSDYSDFFALYGGAYRTKCLQAPESFRLTLLRRLRHSLLGPTAADLKNKVLFVLPARSRLPTEFIRLEPWEAEYLYMLAATAGKGILETGRFRGGSTFMLAYANRRVPIWSIDIAPVDDDALRDHLKSNDIGTNVALIVGDSQHERHPAVGDIDLLFIDGDHSY